MVILFFAVLLALLLLAGLAFLLGFRLGGEDSRTELVRVRLEAAQAERQLHDLTRQAFIAMAERVEQHRQDRT